MQPMSRTKCSLYGPKSSTPGRVSNQCRGAASIQAALARLPAATTPRIAVVHGCGRVSTERLPVRSSAFAPRAGAGRPRSHADFDPGAGFRVPQGALGRREDAARRDAEGQLDEGFLTEAAA